MANLKINGNFTANSITSTTNQIQIATKYTGGGHA